MKYITESLGIAAKNEPWEGMRNFPFYLTDCYTFNLVRLGETKCLFVYSKGALPAVNTVKKHFTKIIELTEDITPVLMPNTLSPRQRKALIAARIPFVLDGVQLYLPFLGALLQERYPAVVQRSETIMPTSQLLLFYYLYQNDSALYTNGLSAALHMSAMQVTRAARQLTETGLFTTHKNGVHIVVKGTDNKVNIFEKAKPHLVNPVKRRIFVDKSSLPSNLPIAGYSALAEYSMLNPPNVPTYAFDGKVSEFHGTNMLVDGETQVEVEFWRYSPTILSMKKRLVDPLSLWATLTDDDPRTEIAKDEMLEGVWS